MDNPFERSLKAFKVKQGDQPDNVEEAPDTLSEQPETLATVNRQEVMNLFGLTRELFEFAQDNNLGHEGGFRYSDVNNEFSDNPFAIELPQKFYPIIAEYPGKYWAVSFEDRFDPYYAKGTNMRLIKLSTVPKRSQTDDKIREISVSEPAPSEGLGNIQFMFVRDSLMNKSFATINTASENQTDSPYGSAEMVYELDPVGSKKLVNSEFNRMDEGIFEWDSAKTPVRWLRYLRMRQDKVSEAEIQYEDSYILGRHHQREDHKDTRVQVKITSVGKLDAPESMVVSIGSEVGSKNTVLFEDSLSHVKVVLHDNDPWTTKEKMVKILKQDPNYAFLFEGDIDTDKLIELLKRKADLITNDWDKKSTVFSGSELEEGRKTLEQ